MNPEHAAVFSQTNFTGLDWVIVAAYLSISLVIGLFVRKYVVNMAGYISAGRGLGTCLGIATMTGTEMGLITVMYSAQKGFTGGFAAFHIALVAGVVTFFVGASGFIVGRLRATGVLTIPEYYQERFDKKTRVLGGIMLALGGILNMGLFLKVGSMFIVGVTGMSATGWALPVVMIVLLSLALIYTVLGGMFSVVVTDYVQFVVLSAGLLITTGLAISHVGWDHMFTTIVDEMGAAGFNPLVSEGSFGVEYVIWMAFTAGLVSCALWPTAVARALAAEDVATVKKQYMFSSISFMIRFLIPNFLGIAAFVLIATKAPELQQAFFPSDGSEGINNLYAMPVFLGRVIPAGLLGLISAAMIAAFMSTHDSYLLVWSSVITQDIIAPLKGGMSTKARILCTRVCIVVIGLYILYWGLVYEGKDDIWDYMAITGAIYFTGSFAVLVGGLYWKKASSTGAFLALISGLGAIIGLGPVKTAIGLGEMTGASIGLITVCFSVAVMVLGSLLFPDKPAQHTNDGSARTEVVA